MGTRPTIVDVARDAGVAISTASGALNNRHGISATTRVKVQESAAKLGFVPSMRGRNLSSRKSFSVGMVLQRDPRVLEADPFFMGFIGGVESELIQRSYSFVLQLASSRPQLLERMRALSLSRGVDGVFLADSRVKDARYALVSELDLPAVVLNVDADKSPLATVTQDHAAALREIVEGLINLGHRRIAHVSGTPGYVHTAQRERIWRQGLTQAGLEADLLFKGDFSTHSGQAAAQDLLNRPDPPTAVICVNDLAATGFLAGARALGVSVPDDVSVTGFEGIQLAEFTTPALTTVKTSPYDLGVHAARLLLSIIDGGPRADVSIEPATVLWRASVTAPRH